MIDAIILAAVVVLGCTAVCLGYGYAKRRWTRHQRNKAWKVLP